MRLLIVVYDQGIDATVSEHMEEHGITAWTKVFDAHGEGGAGRKLGDAVWPGMNNLLYIQLPDEQVEEVVKGFREIQARYRLKPGITVWSLPVDAL